MTVSEQTPYIEYAANGTTTSFALEFDCDGQDHLIVLVDDIEPVVGAWSLSNGAVVFNTAPENGKKITIQRNTPFRRDEDFQSYDNSFRPPGVNKGFDKIWLKLQELGVADWILSNRIDALKAYVDQQDGILQGNINSLKTYVDDKDDELRAYLLEEIRKQGVSLDQLDDYYNYLMERLAQIAVQGGWEASFVVDASGNTQQQINDNAIALAAPLWGLKGNGTDERTALLALLNFASLSKVPVDLIGLTIITSPLSLSYPVKFVGRGTIKLKANSNSVLIDSSSDFVVDGNITLDPNILENSGGTIGNETHSAIKHSGSDLILKGAKVKPSASNNIVSRATGKIICKDLDIDGGLVCLHLIPRPYVKVDVIGGTYKNASLYDNVQVLNGSDVNIRRVTSYNAGRSGIVVNNTTSKARIIGNNCYNNKIDSGNQGGWGIVASVDTYDTVVSGNTCTGNQRGGISIDTYPAAGVTPLDNRIIVSGNTVDGEYNGTYSTSGISLNGATHSIVSGNNIRKVGQGIHTENAKYASITGNEVQDISSYFVQLNKSHGSVVEGGNNFDGCSNASGGALSFVDTDDFKVSGNIIDNLTGLNGNAFRVSGTSKDWEISNNKVTRRASGGGFAFHVLGAANTGGIIKGNTVNAKVADAFQWNIVSDNSAQFSTHDNHIKGINTGTARYIFQGANVTAGNDTVNGLFNSYATEPVWKSRTGQVATIAGIVKSWNGTAWINAAGASASVTYDPPSLAAGVQQSTTVTLTGAVVGMAVACTFSNTLQGTQMWAEVTAANTVTVYHRNGAAGSVDLPSGTLAVKLI